MTLLERLLCRLGLHAWGLYQAYPDVFAVCARQPAHRRLIVTDPAYQRGIGQSGDMNPKFGVYQGRIKVQAVLDEAEREALEGTSREEPADFGQWFEEHARHDDGERAQRAALSPDELPDAEDLEERAALIPDEAEEARGEFAKRYGGLENAHVVFELRQPPTSPAYEQSVHTELPEFDKPVTDAIGVQTGVGGEVGESHLPVEQAPAAEGVRIPPDPPARQRQPGRKSSVPCIDENRHFWGAPDADSWLRCMRGCGAGRRPGKGVVFAPSKVPPLPGAAAREPSAVAGGLEPADPDAPAPVEPQEASREAARPAIALLEEEDEFPEVFDPRTEPGALEALSLKEDAEGDDVEEIEEADEDVEPPVRGPVLDGAEIARRYHRPEPATRLVAPSQVCPRCAQAEWLDHDPEDGSEELVCVNGHRRPARMAADLGTLQREIEDDRSKLRRRQPSHGKLRL